MSSVTKDHADIELRVYSEKNKKVDHKLSFSEDMVPYVAQTQDATGLYYTIKWQRIVFAGDRPDEIERLIEKKGREFFRDKVVKLTNHDEARAIFFKADLDRRSTMTSVHKIKRYNEKVPFDLYLFELELYHKNLIHVDLNVVPMDKLPEDLSAEHLA